MGKGTDKLYITHSEWASEDAYSASAGAGVAKSKGVNGAAFKRLPFNFCAVSLQPFSQPVCTAAGTIFDHTNILEWLKKHGTNPIDGKPLKSSELIKLHFAKNDDGEYVDPVTYKPLTDNTHIVALKNSGNAFSWDTVERLNIKAKNWRDLVSDDEFSRKDIVTLQDPQNLAARDLSSFKYIKDGTSTLTEEQEREREDPSNNVNLSAMGSSAKILRAKEAVAKAREERAANRNPNTSSTSKSLTHSSQSNGKPSSSTTTTRNTSRSVLPYNAALHTTGKAAASLTSTGLTPHTSADRATISDEDYMLKPRRIKQPGYARLQTSHGNLNIELHTEYAPRAVWNFVRLAQSGYYKGVQFHRNIRNFMLQGGDPTGTGRGGQSIWGKPFEDEYAQSPLAHKERGVLSMANKGKNTNTSQFFVTYRAARNLDRKHTIFGRAILDADSETGVESAETLKRMENAPTDADDSRPLEPGIEIEDVVVFVDPFEEFQRALREGRVPKDEDRGKSGGKHSRDEGDTAREEDVDTTWTGRRVQRGGGEAKHGDEGTAGGVGKYLEQSPGGLETTEGDGGGEVDDEFAIPEPPSKKRKAGGFGNFDAW